MTTKQSIILRLLDSGHVSQAEAAVLNGNRAVRTDDEKRRARQLAMKALRSSEAYIKAREELSSPLSASLDQLRARANECFEHGQRKLMLTQIGAKWNVPYDTLNKWLRGVYPPKPEVRDAFEEICTTLLEMTSAAKARRKPRLIAYE